MRYHEDIVKHLIIRCGRLAERLGREPSFLPVGRWEVKEIAQYNIDKNWSKLDDNDRHETVVASFTGILPPLTIWIVSRLKLKQI